MNANTHVLVWASGISTLVFAVVLIGAIVVAITKLQEFNRPTKWLLAALSCVILPMLAGMVLNFWAARALSIEQFRIVSIGFGALRTIFNVFSIAFFVTAVYSDRGVLTRLDGEEFLSGNSETGARAGVDNPFESPQF